MLVLSRKINESIRIGDDISITIVGIKADGSVRLGFEAPRHVTVHREEVYQSISIRQEGAILSRDSAGD